jgi:hypothetical protein
MPLLSECPRFLTYEELRASWRITLQARAGLLSVFMDPWEGSACTLSPTSTTPTAPAIRSS